MSNSVETPDLSAFTAEPLTRIAVALERIADSLRYLAQERLIEKTDGAFRRASDQVETDIYSGEPPDFSALAKEAEDLLNAAATPDVGRTVKVDETVEKEITKVLPKLNVFYQPRTLLDTLAEKSPGDKIINDLLSRLAKFKKENTEATAFPLELHVLRAAIELVYSYLPVEMWSTDSATKEIGRVIAMHDGSPYVAPGTGENI